MKITYISHATLLIEFDGVKLVTDPWVIGSAYCEQWHLFPKALSPDLINDANYVLYSHGHEDHLHGESLQKIQKNVEIHYPYSWYGGTKEFFHEMGFNNVKEALNEQSFKLGKHFKVTYLSNNLDNVVVIEINNKIIVNINDALPSASESMIAYFIKKIKTKWPKIDYVFSSYGGASYFPNTVHFKNKNDKEIGETRELFFVNNFSKIVSGLQPKFAIPFASDFVLLDDDQRWINECKFPRDQLKSFYQTYTKGLDKVEVIEAYPNDYFEDDVFYKKSPYHALKAKQSLLDRLDTDYANEIAEKKKTKILSKEELDQLFEKIKTHILNKQYIIPENTRKKIKFAVKIKDGVGENILQVNFREENRGFKITNKSDNDIDLKIEIRSKTILHSLDHEWGGDAIIIGYGAEIFILNEDAVRFEYENYCVRLLSRYPNTKEYLKKTPFRALKYLMSDDIKRKNLVNKIFGRQDKVMDFSEAKLGNRDLWLNKDKCEVCKACNI